MIEVEVVATNSGGDEPTCDGCGIVLKPRAKFWPVAGNRNLCVLCASKAGKDVENGLPCHVPDYCPVCGDCRCCDRGFGHEDCDVVDMPVLCFEES